jgi:hypothetical protein
LAKQVVVLSPPGSNLTIDFGEQRVEAVASNEPGHQYAVVEAASAARGKGGSRSPPPTLKGDEPEPPWPIIMSLYSGLPEGVSHNNLISYPQVRGVLTAEDLAQHLAATPDGGRTVLVLNPDHA